MSRGRPKGSVDPAYAKVMAFARARRPVFETEPGKKWATEAVREAIEALGIDFAGVSDDPAIGRVRDLLRSRKATARRLGRYSVASDDSVVEYLARQIVRSAS